MNETRRNEYVGYEYKEMVIDSEKISRYLDGYQNFGWNMDENQPPLKESGKVRLRLKRDRKILNKTELTRLQRHFEDCMNQIDALEQSKTSKATIASLVIGMIGTAFMAGSTFAVVNDPPIIWLCILLAIPGFLGWILPYFVYSTMVRRHTGVIAPLIEDKYNEMDSICEKGNGLL